MDDKSAIGAVAAPLRATTADGEKTKKNRGPFSLLKAALFMTRRRTNGKSKSVQVEVASKDMLKKLVGSMRPLHLQDDHSPPPPPPPPLLIPNSPSHDHDMFSQPISPASSSCSSVDSMSRYASATNLQELEKGGESRYASAADLRALDNEGETSDDDMNEMINVKADEFIAHFYQQMRIQSQELMDR